MDDALLQDALDFIEAQEWGRKIILLDGETYRACLDCGAEKGQDHSEPCWWLRIMKRAGRR